MIGFPVQSVQTWNFIHTNNSGLSMIIMFLILCTVIGLGAENEHSGIRD